MSSNTPQPLSDPRDMRVAIDQAAWRGERIDGSGRPAISCAAGLAKNCLTTARIAGFSGEDTMTLLAYHALLMLEQLNDRLLEFHNLDLRPRVFVKPERLQADAQDHPPQG